MNDQEITLTIQQSQKYQLLKAALDGHATNAQAAGACGLSVRQVQRYKRRIQRLGPAAVRHGNAGRQPANKLSETLRQKILQLAGTTYADYNFSHMANVLPSEQDIVVSDETLRRLLRPQGHGTSHAAAGSTASDASAARRRANCSFWTARRITGSPDYEPICLLLSTDDATGKPLYGKFQPQEDRDGCLEVCYRTFLKHGLPLAYYLDPASQFITTDHLAAKEGRKMPPTAFQIAMDALNIELIFANSPQARGRGERINGSFQNRLVAELVRYGIHDCKRATRYLNQVFIPRYAKRFGRPAPILSGLAPAESRASLAVHPVPKHPASSPTTTPSASLAWCIRSSRPSVNTIWSTPRSKSSNASTARSTWSIPGTENSPCTESHAAKSFFWYKTPSARDDTFPVA